MFKQMLALKKIFLLISSIVISSSAFSESASKLRDRALEKDTVEETVDYILSNLSSVDSQSGKKGLWIFVAGLQELNQDWGGASKSYLQATRISDSSDSSFPSFTADELRLKAAKCFLNAGDFSQAKIALDSVTKGGSNEKFGDIFNLYSAWVSLCQAKSTAELKDPVNRLKSYLEMDSMKNIRAAILFTLWYVEGDDKYSESLKKQFPSSPEYSIVLEKTDLAGSPFWYFVPRRVEDSILENYYKGLKKSESKKKDLDTNKSTSQVEKNKETSVQKTQTVEQKKESGESQKTEEKKSSQQKLNREQLGLFRSKENAGALISRVKAKGFDAYYFTETRASGTTYFIVVVNENPEGTMGKKLRAAGFDCYPVE